jgi:hypothetical protein
MAAHPLGDPPTSGRRLDVAGLPFEDDDEHR